MPTREVPFNEKTYRLAIEEADGRHKTPMILRDPGYEGLTIRISGKSASWYCRFRRDFYRLGTVGVAEKGKPRVAGAIYSARDADEIASRVREMVRLGQEPETYITARALGHSHEDASATAGTIVAKAAGAWTFGRMLETFIEKKIAADTVTPTAVKPAKPNTIAETRQVLLHPDLDHLRGKLARDITRADIEAVRDKWLEEGFPSRQRKLITYVKSAFRWTKAKYAAAGLGDVLPWWIEMEAHAYASKEAIAKARGEALPRTLTPADVARLLFVAERHRVVPGRRITLPTDEVTMALLWWVALSVQRTHAAAVVRTARVIDYVALDGWFDVSWLPADMKSGRLHVLPIPPEVYRRTIARALAAPDRRESIWVFPSTREKDRGKDSRSDRPVGDTILNSLLRRLRGEDADEKGDGSGYDLLAEAGLPRFTLHSLRDAMTTYLADTDLPPGTASAILDHAMPKDGHSESDTARKHYNNSHRLPMKFAGLSKWADAVLREYGKLLVEERRRRFGPLSLEGQGLRRILAKLDPADAWLFDRHLPPALGTTKPAPGRLDLRLVAETASDEPDGWDEREVG